MYIFGSDFGCEFAMSLLLDYVMLENGKYGTFVRSQFTVWNCFNRIFIFIVLFDKFIPQQKHSKFCCHMYNNITKVLFFFFFFSDFRLKFEAEEEKVVNGDCARTFCLLVYSLKRRNETDLSCLELIYSIFNVLLMKNITNLKYTTTIQKRETHTHTPIIII